MSCRVVESDPAVNLLDAALQFTLTYDGPLKSANSTSAEDVYAIKRRFHRQMRRLWDTNAVLQNWRVSDDEYARQSGDTTPSFMRQPLADDQRPLWRDSLAHTFVRANGWTFVPLVRAPLHLACAVEIDLLMNAQKNPPDLDNVQKTLFDALKMPDSERDKRFFATPPTPDEGPFFCLLEDDRLVTHVQSRFDDLPSPLSGGGVYVNSEARCTIRVSLNPSMLTADNARFSQGNISLVDATRSVRTQNPKSLTNDQMRSRVAYLAERIRDFDIQVQRLKSAQVMHQFAARRQAQNDAERQALWDEEREQDDQVRQYIQARWTVEYMPEARALA